MLEKQVAEADAEDHEDVKQPESPPATIVSLIISNAIKACELDYSGMHLRQWLHGQDKLELKEEDLISLVSAMPEHVRAECIVALWSLVQKTSVAYSLFKICPSMGQRILSHRLGPLTCIDSADPAGSFSLDLQYQDAQLAVNVLLKAMSDLPKYRFTLFEIDKEPQDEVDQEHGKSRQEWEQFRQEFIRQLPSQGICEIVIQNMQDLFSEELEVPSTVEPS